MAEPAVPGQMTVDEFSDWATAQPKGRYELLAGKGYALSPERVGHNETKHPTRLTLREALRARGLSCLAYGDARTVPIDASTSYEPDVLVRCGEPLDPETVKVTDPVVVVEAVSPSSNGLDSGTKLVDGCKLPGLVHCLVLDPTRRGSTSRWQPASGMPVRPEFRFSPSSSARPVRP